MSKQETEQHDVSTRQDEVRSWDGKTIPQDWPVVNDWRGIDIGKDLVFPKESELKWAPMAPIQEDPVIWGLALAHRGYVQIAVMRDQRIYTRFLNRLSEDKKTPQLEIKPWYIHKKKISTPDGSERLVTTQILGRDWEEVTKNAAQLLQSTEFRARVFVPASTTHKPIATISDVNDEDVSQ